MPNRVKDRPDDPALRRDVREAYLTNFKRFVVLGVCFLVLAGCFLAYTRQQAQNAHQSVVDLCQLRHVAVVKANSAYQRLAAIERTDRNADPATRAARTRLYENLMYVVPNCASL